MGEDLGKKKSKTVGGTLPWAVPASPVTSLLALIPIHLL